MGLEHFNELKSKDEKVRLKALSYIVRDCKNAGGAQSEPNKAFDYALGRLVKGMQSNILATRVEFFAGLMTLLTTTKNVNDDAIMDLIDKALVSTGGDTKNERRMMNVARIMAYGAVIKAKCCSSSPNIIVARKALKNIVAVAEKKKAFRSLATPFICHLLSNYHPGKLDQEIVSTLEPLLVKEGKAKSDLDYMKIVLCAENRGLAPSLGSVDDIEELVEIILAGVGPDDTEVLNIILNHVKKRELFEEFWKLFVVKLGPYQSQLFCTCVSISVKLGCPLKFVLTQDVVHLALSTLHTKDLGTDVRDKAVAAFRSLLTWKNDSENSLTQKERKKALQILFKGTPNLLHEYQILVGVIKSYLPCLSAKELGLVAGYLINSVLADEASEKSTRNRLSALALLSHILQLKNCSPELQVEIAKLFFHHGFCEVIETASGENAADIEKKVDENLQQHCSSLFLTAIRKSIDISFVTTIYDYVISVTKSAEESYKLTKALDDEVQSQLKRAGKLLGKVTQPSVEIIAKVGALQLVTNSDAVLAVYEDWLDLAKKSIKKDVTVDIVQLIVDQVVATETPFFNHEAIFRRFAMEGKITEEAVQILAGAIDTVDADDEDDDDSDIDESDQDDDEEIGDGGKLNGLNESLFSKPTGDAVNGDSGSEESLDIDMDDATEEDLKKMDDALAGVFATKKRVKEQSKLNIVRYMRVLNLVDILLGRFKEPPISAVLILLMPLVSSVKSSISIKANNNILNRTLATLRRLNKFKKFADMKDLESEILSTMASEIQLLMKKKTVPKEVKKVLSGSINNLLMSSADAGKVDEIKGKKNKKKQQNKSTQLTPQSQSPQAKINSKTKDESSIATTSPKSKKKQLAKAEDSASDSKLSAESAPLPVKRKAQGVSEKKKAKLRRMQVLNEGLSINE